MQIFCVLYECMDSPYLDPPAQRNGKPFNYGVIFIQIYEQNREQLPLFVLRNIFY